jgi:hypothetical protein
VKYRGYVKLRLTTFAQSPAKLAGTSRWHSSSRDALPHFASNTRQLFLRNGEILFLKIKADENFCSARLT